MGCFRNILVGVDLAQYDPVSAVPTPRAGQLVRQALWLAGANAAGVTFFSVLNMTEEALSHLEETDRSTVQRTLREAAEQVLAGLVRQAQGKGIKATSRLVLGTPWLEIVRQVLHQDHDLLLIGIRDRPDLARLLFGSTARKLLHHCPCPVWVSRPGPEAGPLNVLVASGLGPVTEGALRLVLHLALFLELRIHLLHVVDYPLDHIWSVGLPDPTALNYHRSVRAAAERVLREQLEKAADGVVPSGVEVHLLDGADVPDPAILEFIAAHHIDLLAMGTVARSGLAGLLLGNTAERLLPQVPCSVLAVKPPDFHSAVARA